MNLFDSMPPLQASLLKVALPLLAIGIVQTAYRFQATCIRMGKITDPDSFFIYSGDDPPKGGA
jgi:hypothetical protein